MSEPGGKIPRSVLVVVHTPEPLVLLLERAPWPGYWQSVTGSLAREDEPHVAAAIREVREETGIDIFMMFDPGRTLAERILSEQFGH